VRELFLTAFSFYSAFSSAMYACTFCRTDYSHRQACGFSLFGFYDTIKEIEKIMKGETK